MSLILTFATCWINFFYLICLSGQQGEWVSGTQVHGWIILNKRARHISKCGIFLRQAVSSYGGT